jgi:DNA-binding NtrC family response regulator
MDKILIVDNECTVHASFRRMLEGEYKILSAFSWADALRQVTDVSLRLVLLDVQLPDHDGLETLQSLKHRRPDLPVILMSACDSAETIIRTAALGAEEYLTKPFDQARLKRLITDTLRRWEVPALVPDPPLETFDPSAVPILGQSQAMQEVYKLVGKSTDRDVTVLITGESGTGKELIARALHTYSQRAKGPFLAINCTAIPDTLLESELFGYERGAFSGATEARPGHFELAHRGTLFLDEIGDMPLPLQGKLLRVLQEREVHPLGASRPRRIDVRLIAATNQEPEVLLETGRFRQDLYYRLNVVRIALPPLRERDDDILLLADHFLSKHRRVDGRGPQGFSAEARKKLLVHTWPGNVRELENTIARAVLSARGRLITPEDLGLTEAACRSVGSRLAVEPAPDVTIEGLFRQYEGNVFTVTEQLLVAKALELTQHNQVRAAHLLGISRNVLRDRMRRYGL